MATKSKKPTESANKTPVAKYPKATLLKAERWKDRHDLLNALLVDGKVYAIDEVDQMINEYFNKEV